MPSILNLKFRYVFVYKKIILIITKHVLYKECFPDELNYLFCFNVFVQSALAPWCVGFVGMPRDSRTAAFADLCDLRFDGQNKQPHLLCRRFVWNTVPLSCYLFEISLLNQSMLLMSVFTFSRSCPLFSCSLAWSLLFWLTFCCKYVHYHFICVFRPAPHPWCFCFSKVNAKMSLCWFHLYISFKKGTS